MVRKKKIIQVPTKNVELIAKAMQVGRVAVYNALAFRSDSENAQQIRKVAIEAYGGIEVYKYIM